MSKDELIKLLRLQPFVDGMPEKFIPMIADCAELKSFSEDDYLLRQNQPAQCFFLLRKGHVSLRTRVPSKGVLAIETLGPSAILGWSWLVAPYQWHFDAVAMDATETIQIHTPCILGKIENDKELGFEMYQRFIEVIVNRLQSTRLQLMDVYAKPEQQAL